MARRQSKRKAAVYGKTAGALEKKALLDEVRSLLEEQGEQWKIVKCRPGFHMEKGNCVKNKKKSKRASPSSRGYPR
jgi:hypothetical protein